MTTELQMTNKLQATAICKDSYSYHDRNALYFCASASGVPSSAVLVFDIELVSFEKGVPPGYLFVWLEETPVDLFEALDVDKNKEVPQDEVGHRSQLDSSCFC